MPTQLDEQNTYTNVLRWTWSAGDAEFDFAADPGAFGSGIDVHNDTENDDLWTWYQQYLRTRKPLALTWARRWRDYFVNVYPTDLRNDDSAFDYCHLYGAGLVLWSLKENDPAAMAAAAVIGDIAMGESGAAPTATGDVGYAGGRKWARWTILATYLAQALGTTKWINYRDALLNRYVSTTSWEEAGTRGIVQGGHYFVARSTYLDSPSWNGTGTASNFDAGRRLNSTFMYGLHAEAVWRGYLATRRADLRDKLIKMARFVQFYGHDPADTDLQFTSGFFGHENGARWRRDRRTGASATYDISVVNTLVFGYKLTGDAALLARAHAHFRQGTRWAEAQPAGGQGPLVSATDVAAFVDTRRNPDQIFFTHNKGQLLYCYQLFENGGAPSLIT